MSHTVPQETTSDRDLRQKRPMAGFYDERSAKRQDQKMDLHVSYVGKIKVHPPPKRPPRPPRWRHHGDVPLNDPKSLPDGWHAYDFDIDPEDYEALIKRCDERIEDNIFPHIWEFRKKTYVDLKAKKDAMIAAEPGETRQGLSWEVVQRLDSLKGIEEWLSDRKDDVKLLSTVAEIKKAYRSGNLGWNHGLVTYWSHGKQISQPRPFNWDEFTRINQMYDGHEGFWVEGLHGYRDSQIGAIQQQQTTGQGPGSYVQGLNVTFRLMNQQSSAGVPVPAQNLADATFYCRDDTGCDFFTLSHNDVMFLQQHTNAVLNFNTPPPPIMGVGRGVLADGSSVCYLVRALQVNIRDDTGAFMLPVWDHVQVCVLPGQGNLRLIGPWLRARLFTASAPDTTGRTWIFNQKGAINQRLPNPTLGSGAVPRVPTMTVTQYQAATGSQYPGHPGPVPGGPPAGPFLPFLFGPGGTLGTGPILGPGGAGA